MKAQVDKSGLKAQVTIPGFAYDDFDKTGAPNAYQIIRMIDRNFWSVGLHEDWFDYWLNVITPEKATFIKTYHIKTTPHFQGVMRRMKIRQPFKLNSNVTMDHQTYEMKSLHSIPYIGRTSYLWKTVICDAENMPLIQNVSVLVYVDRKNGMPSPFPQEVLQRMHKDREDGEISNTEKPIRLAIPETPANACTYSASVSYCDIDLLGHASNTIYPKLCIESAAKAFHIGYYRNVSQQLWQCFCDEFYIDIVSECNYGDTLDVATWQDSSSLTSFYFKGQKTESRKMVFSAFMKLELPTNDHGVVKNSAL